ncbi:hypothetical protein HanIR_Chr01g0008371 [Helianthus annuus]|nr:hypothetical protein HanIR_Chr01g0008371 [Helianthus annuus]
MASFDAPLIRKVAEFWSICIKCGRSSKLLASTFGALIAAPRLPTVGRR